MDENDTPFNISSLGVPIFTNAWSNVWEWGNGERAYRFANADYKVRSGSARAKMKGGFIGLLLVIWCTLVGVLKWGEGMCTLRRNQLTGL